MDDLDLTDQMERVNAGDEVAVRDLLRRFEGEVRMVVRGRLPRTLRSQFDSMDFVQAVWQSVLTKRGPDLSRFESAGHFLAFLSGVARNKVFEEHRRRTRTRKYELGREEPLYVRRGGREVPRDLAANDPTPSEDAQAGDRLAQLLEGRSEAERQMIELRRSGLTYEEIARRLGTTEGVVRRAIDAIRQRMEARRWR